MMAVSVRGRGKEKWGAGKITLCSWCEIDTRACRV